MYTKIVDPITSKLVDVSSNQGKRILAGYFNHFQGGGVVNSELNRLQGIVHTAKKTLDEAEKAYGVAMHNLTTLGQKGGDECSLKFKGDKVNCKFKKGLLKYCDMGGDHVDEKWSQGWDEYSLKDGTDVPGWEGAGSSKEHQGNLMGSYLAKKKQDQTWDGSNAEICDDVDAPHGGQDASELARLAAECKAEGKDSTVCAKKKYREYQVSKKNCPSCNLGREPPHWNPQYQE